MTTQQPVSFAMELKGAGVCAFLLKFQPRERRNFLGKNLLT